MDDLIEEPGPPGNAPVFSVTEISGAVKRVIEGEFSHIRVRGEIGRVSRPRSGHVYLDLKDDRSVLAGVIWKGVAARLDTAPEEGLEVVATGRLTTFGQQSRYQIVIEELRPAGQGALMAMLEKRKKALAAEGLFAAERKRPLPFLPDVIGVVTSPSGAVIRDILHRLRDRFPRKVLIWPVAVQGAACAPEVARAIEGFNTLTPGGPIPRPDLLIVARGGGSIEDLWGFNEEVVVRAAAASDIPLISAVGHETDTTLIDFAADQRAPTPTAAAELAVPVRLELLAWVDGQGARLSRSVATAQARRAERLRDLARALPRPESLLAPARQRFDLAAERLPAALTGGIRQRKASLVEAAAILRPATLRGRLREDRRRLDTLSARLGPALLRTVRAQRDIFVGQGRRLRGAALTREISARRQTLSALSARMDQAARTRLDTWQSRLEALDGRRQALGYRETLARGYAVVRDGDRVVGTRARAAEAAALEIEFRDGRLAVGKGRSRSPRKAAEAPDEQGSLF